MSVQEARIHAVVASTRRSRHNTQQVWRSLCQTLGADAHLSTIAPIHTIHYLEIFSARYRSGEISKSHKPVRAHTVETALADVGALFSNVGLQDPRLQRGGTTYVPALKKYLVALQKEDPASTRVYPCNTTILRALFMLSNPIECQIRSRDLAVVAFYYMNRPGEVVRTSKTDTGRSSPFTLKDVSFTDTSAKTLSVARLGASLLNDGTGHKTPLTGCASSSLTYTDQKNCIKGEKVDHAPSDDDHICPVRALERIVTHLLLNHAPLDTPLHTYYIKGKRKDITTTLVTGYLRAAAKEVGPLTGIPPHLISCRSLRPGGATALLCAARNPPA